MDALAIKSLIPDAIAKDVVGLPFWTEALELTREVLSADLQDDYPLRAIVASSVTAEKYLLKGDLPDFPKDSLFSIAAKVPWAGDRANVIILLPQVTWSEEDGSYIALRPDRWPTPYIFLSLELPESPDA